ncbi:MAG: AAA family ATPase [Lachnospiraceae bacterium]|nr:AAA family ATPase [Lachnospiraceae bacterium]
MARTVGIGIQDFSKIIENNYFYVDKTDFIKEWWESGDEVTLITRPRRFGKTLNMSMLEQFFSVHYAEKSSIFKNLSIWKEQEYRTLQGTYPVISLSFANVKETDFQTTKNRISKIMQSLYIDYEYLLESEALAESEKEIFRKVMYLTEDADATLAIHNLSKFLYKYYGKKAIVLLDEYDTPMQEAYVNGYWDELVSFTRSMFNAAFKTNPYLARGLMTGITRVSKESIFSDLNNLKVVTTTSDEYADCFGFTEYEVFVALDEYGYQDKERVKHWYDGFFFGSLKDIYNPWSILNYLDTGKFTTYWANTSSNSLVGKLIREGSKGIKTEFERLLEGEHLITPIDEQIVYNQLNGSEKAIWSLLLASGYLKVLDYEEFQEDGETITEPKYELAITNYEVKLMFHQMVRGWFDRVYSDYNDFEKALLLGDVEAMNEYMNRVSSDMFSYFDTTTRTEPERFYHGFVLGLMVSLSDRYVITSNRESGFGRYDIMLEPKNKAEVAIIIEFKVFNIRRDKTIEDTVQTALQQIEDKNYEADLIARGVPKENIRKYGFAFQGKEVCIGE